MARYLIIQFIGMFSVNWREGITINSIFYSPICFVRDSNGCHYVEIQKSVKSTDRFLIMLMTCILMY